MRFRKSIQRLGDVQSLGDIFPEIVKEYRLEQPFVVESLAMHWKDLVGDIIATHSIPDRLFKRILFIAVDHPVYGNEITLMKNSVLRSIEEMFGSGLVTSIKTEVKKLNWRKAASGRNIPE